MNKNQSGFTLIELLVVLVVIGFMFYFLIQAIDVEAVQNKTRNVTIRSAMNKVVLSVEGYRSSYDHLPDEVDFIGSLKESTSTLEASCDAFGSPDYECIFKPSGSHLPVSCDISHWRSDFQDNRECFMRYYAGASLGENGFEAPSRYRLYAKIWDPIGRFLVFDSKDGGSYYYCPTEMLDSHALSYCEKL